jgi:hypothetical protein
MKQSLFLFVFLMLITTSCFKHDEVVYSQEDLNGTWETQERNSMDCIQELEISSEGLSEIKICEGVKLKFRAQDYSFDGRIIRYSLYGLNMKFEIYSLTDQRLLLGYHDPVEYKRISD